MITLRVVTAGLQATVQDLGRAGHQHEGVPAGGAMDRQAIRVANLLVGNEECSAALEISLIGPALALERDTLFALTGGDLEASVDHMPVPTWHPVWAPRGSTLRFGRVKSGCRVYLAVAGGLDVPRVFGSRATYLRASFGGLCGRAIKAGDLLSTNAPSTLSERIGASLRTEKRGPSVARWSIGSTLRPPYSDDVQVRLIPGAHLDRIAASARDGLLGGTFRVSSSSDRMGYRLEGKAIALREPVELLSEGVTFGTVQLPPGGAPIVLMADAQTTGGYPRLGEVASVDLPLIAQLKPGDRVRFRLTSLERAQAEYLAAEEEIAQARAAIAFRFSRGTS
jgi:antagonist of KipI